MRLDRAADHSHLSSAEVLGAKTRPVTELLYLLSLQNMRLYSRMFHCVSPYICESMSMLLQITNIGTNRKYMYLCLIPTYWKAIETWVKLQ